MVPRGRIKGGLRHPPPMRIRALAVLAVSVLALLPPAQAANFGTHVGAANATFQNAHFRAGALLADLDHFLPTTEPSTDTFAFTQGVLTRAWTGSRNAWRFADGWYEHVVTDARFVDSVARVLAAYPSYTVVDVRLAFDYWTLTEHPFPMDFEWILNDTEILTLVQGGLVSTDLAGVRAAVDRLLHSTDVNAPGLALQLDAARAYGAFYPDRVANMKAEYGRFWWLATGRFVPPLPRLDIELRVMAALVHRYAANPSAVTGFLQSAMKLEAIRPLNWMQQEAAALGGFIDALPTAGLGANVRWNLEDRAEAVI